jgi:hypothetical protein
LQNSSVINDLTRQHERLSGGKRDSSENGRSSSRKLVLIAAAAAVAAAAATAAFLLLLRHCCRVWPEAKYVVVTNAGHSALEDEVRARIRMPSVLPYISSKVQYSATHIRTHGGVVV